MEIIGYCAKSKERQHRTTVFLIYQPPFSAGFLNQDFAIQKSLVASNMTKRKGAISQASVIILRGERGINFIDP